MKKQEDFDKDLKEIIELATELFGDVQEFGANEIRELVDASGPKSDELSDAFCLKVKKVMEDMRAAGKSVPERYKDVLEQVRPLSQPTRNPKYMQSRARAWIEKLIGEVGTPICTDISVSFHNKGELSSSDEKALDEAVERLKKRARERGKT
jgi:hypothetical protein